MQNVNSCCFVSRIKEIRPIPGADNIELAIIQGWNCIVKKGANMAQDLVIVATTDAIIPEDLANDMQITNYLRKGNRVRTVKLKGVYSECLIIPMTYAPHDEQFIEGDDMMQAMNIFKWEPPVKMVQLSSGVKIRYQENPNFTVYYKFPNAKNVPDMFTEDDVIEVSRKIHGTNARYGIVKKKKPRILDRIKKFFGNPWADYEFVVGSHNVEKGSDSQGYYDTNVWYDIDKHLKIKQKMWTYVKRVHSPNTLGSGIILYGEIYGQGIQRGYDYGISGIQFVGFDVTINGKYLDVNKAFSTICLDLDLDYVDVVYMGPYDKEAIDMYVHNNYIRGTKVPHEGVVVKHVSGQRNKIFKVINPEYLIFGEKHDIGDSH